MKKGIAIIAFVTALFAAAADKKIVDDFAAFGGVAARLEHLAKADNVSRRTVEEIDREIADRFENRDRIQCGLHQKKMTDVERDTLAVEELICKIHEACGIPSESGA